MIYYSPYDTTLGKLYKTDAIKADIKAGLINREEYIRVDEKTHVISVLPNVKTKKFEHPLPIEIGQHKEVFVAADMVPFVKITREGTHAIGNYPIYNLQKIRAALTAHIYQEGFSSLRDTGKDVLRTYVDNIVSVLSLSYQLSSDDYNAVRSITAWLYISMTHEEEYLGEVQYQSALNKVATQTGISTAYLERYVTSKLYNGVEDYLEALKEFLTIPSIQQITPILFYNMLSKSIASANWNGVNKNEIMAISVEHIPTFIGILVTVLTEPGFKNTGLAKLAFRNFNKNAMELVMKLKPILDSGIQ